MTDPPKGKRLSASRFLSKLGSKFRRSPSPRPPSHPLVSNQHIEPVPTLSRTYVHSANAVPQDNQYLAVGGLSTVVVGPQTGPQQTTSVGSAVYEGLKTVLEGLYDCSDMFLPLKAASGAILKVVKVAENVAENKRCLEDLKIKLEAIIIIVNKYRKNEGLSTLDHRIDRFCVAINFHINSVAVIQNQRKLAAVARGTNDAIRILKVVRNISIVCDVFQMDTQLNIETTVGEIVKYLDSGLIDKFAHEMTSYKTRQSSYGAPTGCFPDTRVKVLQDLEEWALDVNGSKVYWMVGMAGVGKSTISHTFCEILEAKNMLGGNIFCSRISDKTNNARIIIPVIAHALAKDSPSIACEVVKAVKHDHYLAEISYHDLDEKFKKLIYNPVQTAISKTTDIYKVVVIDAIDECSDLDVVFKFIQVVLGYASVLPLKIFVSSRDEYKIRNAFNSRPILREYFYLHDIEKDVVQKDIYEYLKTSLGSIKDNINEEWPSEDELTSLVDHSGSLFIYASTAFRYISNGEALYRSRLSEITAQGLKSASTAGDIDTIYIHILKKAFDGKPLSEVTFKRDLLSIVMFLQNPLAMGAIASLSEISNADRYLTSLCSIVHIPNQSAAPVAPFHASFYDFVTTPDRCSPEHFRSFHWLVASECHELLALKCLRQMNKSLMYNICGVSDELTQSRRDRTNFLYDAVKISEALRYSCIYWGVHLAGIQVLDPVLVDELDTFLHTHILHWIECLSVLGELQAGLKSLSNIVCILVTFKYHHLQMLVDDARRCLQMSFEAVQNHCMEIYHSALVWLPRKSIIRATYNAEVSIVPKLAVGLAETWGSSEHVMQNGSKLHSVAFSPDGSRVVSGSDDGAVRIWNATTGEVDAELKGHTHTVNSVAFSRDGSRVVSGSWDNTVHIWNPTTGDVEAELKGHTRSVNSVAFSPDGSRVVSGSSDGTVRTWSTTTSQVEVKLKRHTNWLHSVAFSPDGSHMVSGSIDGTVHIWNVMTGEMEAELMGHAATVRSVAFLWDGSRVVSGSSDGTVRIWNATMGKAGVELKGHTATVRSVAFSQDGSCVVSGSRDYTVRIWNTTTGKMDAELKGHTATVRSVAFSLDGSRVVSGSQDRTVRIWDATTGEAEAELKGHTEWVTSVAFSQDGNWVVSGSSDKTVRIWDVSTRNFQLVANSESVILPDGSTVTGTSKGKFHITYPAQQNKLGTNSVPRILYGGQWIVGTQFDCWIPSHYRDVSCHSIWGSQICIGCESGHVVTLDMNIQ